MLGFGDRLEFYTFVGILAVPQNLFLDTVEHILQTINTHNDT